MKNLLILALLSLIFYNCTKEEDPIFTGDVRLSTKEEVKEFDAKHINEINGNLLIGVEDSSDEVSNLLTLSALSSLQKINGDLRIMNNGLVDLYGLDNLTYISGDLQISNTTLQNLNELENIAHFDGTLTIANNNKLTDIISLSNLTTVQSLNIHGNNISTLPFNNISHIPGNLNITYSKLTDLKGLNNLTAVGGEILLHQNDLLTNLGGLNNLITVGGHFRIKRNDNLSSLVGLSKLEEVGGTLNILVNKGLINLNGLSNLHTVESLAIDENVSLYSLDGLKNLNTIEEFFKISFNWTLHNLDGLSNLQTINAHTIIIHANFELTDFCGLKKGLENLPNITIFTIGFNAYDPSRADILNGNCAQ